MNSYMNSDKTSTPTFGTGMYKEALQPPADLCPLSSNKPFFVDS